MSRVDDLSASLSKVFLCRDETLGFATISERLMLKKCDYIIVNTDAYFERSPKLYNPSTLNIDLILWHTQLIVYAVKCKIMV